MNWPLTRRAWSRLAAISLPIFRSEKRWLAFGGLGLILALLLSLNGLNAVNSYVGRGFMTAIAERQSHRFVVLAGGYLAVFAGSTIVAVFFQFTQDRLALMWRAWLCLHLERKYLARQVYYRIEAARKVDNPDQRLAEDVKTFTATLLSFLTMVVNSAITIVTFASILWLITPWLLVTAVAYAACGSLATIWLGRRLPGLSNSQLQKEADLRYALVRVREYAEPIALLQGEQDEHVRLDRRLQQVVENFKRVIGVHRNVGFFTSGYNYLVPLIPVLIVAPRYLRGEVDFGTVTQSGMAFAQIIGALSLMVAQYQSISEFVAVAMRLSQLDSAIDEARSRAKGIHILEQDGRLSF